MSFKDNKHVKTVVGGVLLFVFGMLLGYQINFGALSNLSGYLFNAVGDASGANASGANASGANASGANASGANASGANASGANASNANATSPTDNVLFLKSFSLGSGSIYPGEKVNVSFETEGAPVTYFGIQFLSDDGKRFSVNASSLANNPYITIPKSIVPTTYKVVGVILMGKNANGTTFTKELGQNDYKFNSSLTVNKEVITEENKAFYERPALNSLNIATKNVVVGQGVGLTYTATKKLTSMELAFVSADNKSFNLWVKNINSQPFVVIPADVEAGNYALSYVTIWDADYSVTYSRQLLGNLAFDITVEGTDTPVYIYNNDKINSDILSTLYNAPDGTDISINADSNSIISEELFNTIKGKNKSLTINFGDNQIIFNGGDITNSKTIDVNMEINKVEDKENISKLVTDGVVVTFPDNGNLPGKAIVRIKASDVVSDNLNDSVYVYVYNEATNNFYEVASGVKKTKDGYYEFIITHNSDYLIVNEKLDSSLVGGVDSEDDVVSFQKSNNIYILLICIAIVVIIAAVVVIIILKKQAKNKNTEKAEENVLGENKEEDTSNSDDDNVFPSI